MQIPLQWSAPSHSRYPGWWGWCFETHVDVGVERTVKIGVFGAPWVAAAAHSWTIVR